MSGGIEPPPPQPRVVSMFPNKIEYQEIHWDMCLGLIGDNYKIVIYANGSRVSVVSEFFRKVSSYMNKVIKWNNRFYSSVQSLFISILLFFSNKLMFQ